MLVSVNYHYVRPVFDSPHPGIHGIKPVQLELQLETLGRKFVFVSAEQIRIAIQNDGHGLPEKSLAVTFDDGLLEHYEHAWPVLKRLGIPAIFFVNTAPLVDKKVLTVHKIHLLRSQLAPEVFYKLLQQHATKHGVEIELQSRDTIAQSQYKYDTPQVAKLKFLLNFQMLHSDREKIINACFNEIFSGQETQISKALYMNSNQINELGSLGCIGSHAHEHIPLGNLSIEKAEEQIRLSLWYLEKWIGYQPFALSYPYGSREVCPPQLGHVLSRLGIVFAFTMERAANQDLSQPLFLARFGNNDLPGGKMSKWTLKNMFSEMPDASWYQ